MLYYRRLRIENQITSPIEAENSSNSTAKWVSCLILSPKRYIRSAQLLFQDGDCASAASRLYYAMFYCAEAVLLTEGLTYSRHRGVISGFGQYFVKTGKFPADLHAWLIEAFDKRQIGEYESIPVLTETDIEDLLKKARQFVDEIEAYLKQAGWAS